MFEALRIFEVREPVDEVYVTPAIDTVGMGQVILPPPAPVILDISDYGLIWINMTGVQGFQVEYLAHGTIWQVLGRVPALPMVQILWTGFEWQFQEQVNGVWQVLYRGFQPLQPGSIVGDTAIYQTILTPDQIPIWYLPDGVTPVPGLHIQLGGILDPKGMQVSGAGNSAVDVSYSMPGIQNGRDSYLGPELYVDGFSPEVSVFYRIRAFNQAGIGPASNVVELLPPPEPAWFLDWTALDWNTPQSDTPLTLTFQGDGSGSFFPHIGFSDSFAAAVQCGNAPVIPVGGALVYNEGVIEYPGSGVNCNIHVIAACSEAATTPSMDYEIKVWCDQSYPNFTPIDIVENGQAAGTYDYPFVLPDTGGTPRLIHFSVKQLAAGNGSNHPYNATLNGVVSSVSQYFPPPPPPSCDNSQTGIYAIQGYTDGLVANTSGNAPNFYSPTITQTWDGVFRYKDDGTIGTCDWTFAPADAGHNENVRLVNGKCSNCVSVFFLSNIWNLGFFDDKGTQLWGGVKLTGSTPDGVYTLDPTLAGPSTDSTPLTMTVVKLSGNVTVEPACC